MLEKVLNCFVFLNQPVPMHKMASFLESEVQGTKDICHYDPTECTALLPTVSCFIPLEPQAGQYVSLFSTLEETRDEDTLVACPESLEWLETVLG